MTYELVYILTPKILEKEIKDKTKKILELLKKAGSEIKKEDFWGKKKLAYPIKNFDHGFYTLVEFSVEPGKIKEIDKALRLQEEIIRFLIIKKEEKVAMEKLDKEQEALAKKEEI